MQTSNVVSIAQQHGPEVSAARDQAHGQYVKMAHGVIMHALATRGRAVSGDSLYDRAAACAVVEDMIFSEAGVSLFLIDMAQAFARGEPVEVIGAKAQAMMDACVVFSAHRLADEKDAERVATEFTAGAIDG